MSQQKNFNNKTQPTKQPKRPPGVQPDTVYAYPKRENEELFDKDQIDNQANDLLQRKASLKTIEKKNKTYLDWKDNKEISRLYSSYYRAELADTIKTFNYGEASQATTEKYTSKTIEQLQEKYLPKEKSAQTSFSTENLLTTAATLAKQGIKFAICNPANNQAIGGGLPVGAPNFEEDLGRISDFYIALIDHARDDGDFNYHKEDGRPHYANNECLKNNEALITTNIKVIKELKFTEGDFWYFKQYEKLPEAQQFNITIVSNAALYLNTVRNFTPKERLITKEKLRAQLTALIEAGIDVPVLSDFGCGGFHNKPSEVARIYYELLYIENYAQFFTEIKFNIINQEHCLAFENTFQYCDQEQQDKKSIIKQLQDIKQQLEPDKISPLVEKNPKQIALTNYIEKMEKAVQAYLETPPLNIEDFQKKSVKIAGETVKALEGCEKLKITIGKLAAYILSFGVVAVIDYNVTKTTGFSIFSRFSDTQQSLKDIQDTVNDLPKFKP